VVVLFFAGNLTRAATEIACFILVGLDALEASFLASGSALMVVVNALACMTEQADQKNHKATE